MIPIVVSKSVIEIRPLSKKSVTVGFLVDKNMFTVIILLQCNFTKKMLMIDLIQWYTLISDSIYSSITNNLHTNNCRRIKITDTMYYSANLNQLTIKLYVNNQFITLSYNDLHRIKELQECIDSYIVEKQKKLVSYQSTFNTVYSLIKASINILPLSCQRNDFTNQYIQNFDFSNCFVQNDDFSFMFEILQFHNNSLSDIILNDIKI